MNFNCKITLIKVLNKLLYHRDQERELNKNLALIGDSLNCATVKTD